MHAIMFGRFSNDFGSDCISTFHHNGTKLSSLLLLTSSFTVVPDAVAAVVSEVLLCGSFTCSCFCALGSFNVDVDVILSSHGEGAG